MASVVEIDEEDVDMKKPKAVLTTFRIENVEAKNEFDAEMIDRMRHELENVRLKFETTQQEKEEQGNDLEVLRTSLKALQQYRDDKAMIVQVLQAEVDVMLREFQEQEERQQQLGAMSLLPQPDLKDDGDLERISLLIKETIPGTVVNLLYKVQNPLLMDDYNRQKERMNNPPYKGADERILFHGTSSRAIQDIMLQGLDSRLAGTAYGTTFGHGIYLGTTAYASQHYCQGVMLIVRALVGRYVKGSPEYRRPPPIKNGGSRLYDSCVDREDNPNFFVIFDNRQVYPEYVVYVTFKGRDKLI